jgi:hypothetical protein
MFPEFRVVNGDPKHSDHRHVIVDTGPEERRVHGGGAEFRFEAAWVEEEDCRVVVKEAWQKASAGNTVPIHDVLGAVAGDLSAWGSNVLGTLEKRIKELRKELELCRRGVLSGEQVAREGVLRYRLDKAEEQKDLYWKQRAHVKWMTYGDRNMAFFHASCTERQRKNKIGSLKESGGWVENEVEKRNFITNHFSQLFRSSGNQNSERLLDCVENKVERIKMPKRGGELGFSKN